MPGSPSSADVGDQRYNEVELPSAIEIRGSSVSEGLPGAFCKTLIKKNTRFGPYKGEIIKPGQKTDIDYRYAWEIFEKKRNVLKFTISASDPKASNWMRNVNCARFFEEQNILSTQEGFSIFYVAMKDIKPGEELLTWFDPQLLKRTQRRVSRGERRKVGYTIELVPWTDEKKFVPEIIETKRARKKKVLGEDMLSFEEDAALMQRSMNSMFRLPRKVEPFAQPKRDNVQSFNVVAEQRAWSPKKSMNKTSSYSEQRSWSPKTSVNKTSTHKLTTEKKDNTKRFSTVSSQNLSKTTSEKLLPVLSILNEEHNEKKVVSVLSNGDGTGFKPPPNFDQKETVKRCRKRGRVKGNREGRVRNHMGRFYGDSRNALDTSFEQNASTDTLLKPVVIRKKENGCVEMEDHDETYNISWSSVRQECDDLCQCLDKQGLLKQDNDSSSSLHQASQNLVVRFTLLPEHQTVAHNNKMTYKCDICECSYNHAFSLKRHYLGVHINHRYISKDDAEYCQLETFHSGLEAEITTDTQNCGNGQNSEESVSVSNTLNVTACNRSCSVENSDKAQASSCNLWCTEGALDSSTDESRIEVPTLSSLASAQCEKNKSLLSSSGVSNKLCNELSQNIDSSTLQSTHISCVTPEQLNDRKNILCDGMGSEIKMTTSECKTLNELENGNTCSISSNKPTVTNESTTGMHDTKMSDFSESNDEQISDDVKDLPSVSDSCEYQSEKPIFTTETKDEELNCTLAHDDESGRKFESEKKDDEENSQKEHERVKGEVTNALLNLTPADNAMDKEDELRRPTEGFEGVHRCSQSKTDNIRAEENACSHGDGLSKDAEISQVCNNEGRAEDTLTIPTCEIKAKPNIENSSTPHNIHPIQSKGTIQTPNTNTPQQFLLLVPLGTPSSKIPSLTKASPTSSFNISQCQGNLPVVVLSSQASSTSASSIHLQTSTQNSLCPRAITRPCQGITSVSSSSSNIGQRFALIPQNTKSLVNTNIHPTANTFFRSKTADLMTSCTSLDTTPSDQNTKLLASISTKSSSRTDDSKQLVKLEETDQPNDLYRCHMCVLVYKTMGELKYHIKNDPHRFKGGLKQYACPKCSVRFRNKANLARHTLMHHQVSDDKDRKFRCSTCGKGFTTETYLKMHARFHSGKSFPCKYGCVDAFFPNAGSLVKHLRSVHPGLNLKEYLREKKRRERMKHRSDSSNISDVMTSASTPSNVVSGYNIMNAGVGFQAKRGRPKGSKNAPKELSEPKVNQNIALNISEKEHMPSSASASGTENLTPVEIYPPVKKYYPIEKTWQKGSSFFKISTDESNQDSQSLPRRRFRCKLCGASFKSHLFLLKHRSKRHRARQSVQEFLFEMAKDKEEESPPMSEEIFQFSPPPSPKTFFSRVNQRGAENMSKYIEGSGEMLKYRKKLSFEGTTEYPFSSPPQLEWTHYNFPPCFKYVRDNTAFYHNVAHGEIKPKVERCEIAQCADVNGDAIYDVGKEGSAKDEKKTCDPKFRIIDEGVMREDGSDENTDDLKCEETSSTTNYESGAKDVNETIAKSNKESDVITSHQSVVEQTEYTIEDTSLTEKNFTTVDSVRQKGVNDSNLLIWKPDSVLGDTCKGFKKSQRKARAGMEEMLVRLNKFSLKALDLEIGARYLHKHFNSNFASTLDSLNLFSKGGIETLTHKFFRRRKRERFASVSACSQLLPSKLFCRSRDQLTCSIFNSPDVRDTKRFTMWQGPNCHKVDTEHCGKFCCPVVESVRQQEVLKKRKDIQERNNQEVIDIKPREKIKEDFATSMGLMSRREYERSYHAQEKTEHCIKPPEIWERYDRIWFGKKGTITVVCSICHRHFSCQELCLRHQLKKHPHIEPSSLEMERDNYVEDMYYYYPMPYGILAQTHLIPEKMPPPELYVCTRCRFPFKNLNKLYSHIVACDPNSGEQAAKRQSVVVVGKTVYAVPSVTNRSSNASDTNYKPPQPSIAKPQRQRLLNCKYKNYQLFNKSVKSMSQDHLSVTGENKAQSRNGVSSTNTKSPCFMNFSSSFQRMKTNQHGLLYNPLNHTRRRELVHVLDQHQCHGCNLKFNSMSMLERHVKKCSGKDKLQNQKPLLSGVADEMMVRKQHTCRYCNKRFTFIKGVDLHYKRICAVRKIREEENQLTEEDLAHEAELQRIIEHLKWSKSLNQDSSDIIQGRVKVEEDGSLTRVEKKRGRPFGKGKRIKKKGFKWTTLKYHRPDDENSVTSGEPISSVEESLSNESLEQPETEELSKKPMNQTSRCDVKQEGKLTDKLVTCPVSDISKRKRGRPFKNGDRSQPQRSDQPKRKRGRPPKTGTDTVTEMPAGCNIKTEMSLKESIDFKRGELRKENFMNVKTAAQSIKVAPSIEPDDKVKKLISSRATPIDTMQSDAKSKASFLMNESLKAQKMTAASEQGKRKLDGEVAAKETTAKPPTRARGRPKKFDPSDMESSYKKKKKTDLCYIPFVKRTSKDGIGNDLHTDVEDSKVGFHSEKTTIKDCEALEKSCDTTRQDSEKLKIIPMNTRVKTEVNEMKQKALPPNESITPDDKKEDNESSQPKISGSGKSYKIVVKKSSNAVTTEKRSGDGTVGSISELALKTSEDSTSQMLKSCDDTKKDVRKRKPGTSSIEVSQEKMAKHESLHSHSPEKERPLNQDAEYKKTVPSQQPDVAISQCNGQTEGTTAPVSQERHVTVTMASASANGEMVQTPVAVRIVTLPISSLATTVPSNIVSPTKPSLSIQPLPATTSPLMKLTINPNPQAELTNKTLISPGEVNTTVSFSTTTTTSTATAKSPTIQIQNIPKDANKSVLQPPTFPVGQIIPISNQKVLVSPEEIHSSVGPRFIIHSSPRLLAPRVPIPPVTTTLTRHVSPSTVILSTGKVVSLTSPLIPGSNSIRNRAVQHGANLMKKINVINPPSAPLQQFLPSPPCTIMRKGMGIVVDPPKSTVTGGSPLPPTKSVYYVQTSPLSNQVVMPISTTKPGVSASTSCNPVLLNLNDSKTNAIPVPQLQFIPLSLVQGVGQTLNPSQVVSQPTATPIVDSNKISNSEENDNL